MKAPLPWANPVFVEAHTSNTNGSAECSNDRWVFRSERRFNVQAFAYLLLSEFAGGSIITKCVSESLLSRIFDDERFSLILREAGTRKCRNVQPNKDDESLHQQIDVLLRDAFTRVDADCYEAVTAMESNFENSWDDSAVALTGGCSAVLALVLDDLLYVANCGHSAMLLGKKVGDEMTIFPLSRTMETCGCGLPSSANSSSHETSGLASPERRLHAFLDFTRCRPSSCFGDYSRKPDVVSGAMTLTIEAPPLKRCAETVDATPVPFILPQHIELNDSTKFLLLLSPQTAKIINLLNAGNEVSPNAIFASSLLDTLNSSEGSDIFDAMRDLLNNLLSRFIVESGSALMEHPKFRLNLAMAYINLECNAVNRTNRATKNEDVIMEDDSETGHLLASTSGTDQLTSVNSEANVAEFARPFDSPQNESIGRRHESAPDHIADDGSDDEAGPSNDSERAELDPVPSVVDWSEFYTHELHDTVLAKIESLKQLYQDRRKLAALDESMDH